MSGVFWHKLIVTPLILAIFAVVIIFGASVRANNDIQLFGKLWEQGLDFWVPSITVEPGQEFKITYFAGNSNPDGVAVNNVVLVDDLPQYTSYIAGTSFKILESAANWSALTDDGTLPFDGSGLVVKGGTLSGFEFGNYKYTVKVDNVLPTGTTVLSWPGPVLHFTDSIGAQAKTNMESTSILVENLPAVSLFAIPSGASYKLGDVISVSAEGTSGKTARVEIAGITVNLSESSGTYTGSYTVQSGDDASNITPRLFLVDAQGKGAYKDFSQTITIDATAPASPSNLSASVDPDTLKATITWSHANPSDVSQYNIYSNSGEGDVNYSSVLAAVGPATQYITDALGADKLYKLAVRAQDAAGNIDANTNTADAPTDFVAPNPPASLVKPTTLNDVVFKFNASNPIAFEWASTDSADVLKYRIEIDDNSDFSSVIGSHQTTGTSTSMILTTGDIALPDGIYFWRAFAIDDAELVSGAQTNPDNSFEIDNTNPSLAVAQPTPGSHVSGNFTIIGTGADANTHIGGTTGIAKVEVFLNNLSDNLYWDGTDWIGTPVFIITNTSDNFANWDYEFAASITNAKSYVAGARVVDEAGNFFESALITLTGNTTQPNVNITSPISGGYIGGSTTISGTSSDPGGTVISSVDVKVQRSNDSKYWDGTNWIATETFNTASTSDNFANWTYAFNPDGTSPEGTVFTVEARAKDGVIEHPNTGASAALALNKDTVAPSVNITSPSAASSPYRASTWDAADPIRGTATDAGSGIAGVQVAIQDSAGNYWNGTDWTSVTVVWLNATSSDNFANWKYINTGTDFIPNKDDTFTIYARGTDKVIASPNVSAQGAGVTIVYDTTAPAFANTKITNTTVDNITTLVKNGDVFILSANITDALQAGMTVSGITANLTALTGNGADSAVQPASYATSTGEAMWSFKTVSGTTNGDLGIIINASDPAGNAAVYNNTAIIVADNLAPAIQTSTLTVPSAAGLTYKGGATLAINWTQAHITDTNLGTNPIKFEYDNGLSWTLIASSELNDGSFDWVMPTINSQNLSIRIWATDNVGNKSYDDSDNNFTIDSTAPSVSSSALTSPNGADAFKQGTIKQITWNTGQISDNFGLSANPITLEYTTNGTDWTLISDNEANDGTYDWTVPAIDFNTVKVRITAADAAGNASSDESDGNFAIGLPPVIVEARAVSDTKIEIEWDKPIASAGAFGNYIATGISASAVATTTTPTIVELTVNPIGNTAFTANDLAVALNTVQDTDNFFNEAQSGKSILDKQAPQTNISASYPNSNQLIVDEKPMLRVSVSEEPHITTVIKVDDVSQTFNYVSAEKIIESTPLSTLSFGKHIISIDLIDTALNAEANQTWDFYIDKFTMSATLSPVAFKFDGNLIDEGAAEEQQQISVSTFGAGFTIFARFATDLIDGFGNTISDVDIKQSSQLWADKIDLNGTAQVQIAQVAKLGTPSATSTQANYTFDLRASIPSLAQEAGDYNGTLEFIIVPEY